MRTAVALIIFNRPDNTARVLAEIAKAKPKKLLVVADGPRSDRAGEAEKCVAARAVIDRVDWDCEVLKNYSEVNLGCGRRPATGITWVFEQVEEAIILEDDCVPDPTFFPFCEELLEKYSDNERVMMIAGSNHWFRQKRTVYSYHFSRLPWNWGWATWRRAWQHFDIEIKLWPVLRNTSRLLDILGHPGIVEYWRKIFDKAYAGRGDVDYWDYQWTFACWANNGLCVFPNTNIISNIGFGEEATHTKRTSMAANLPTFELKFPLQHPTYVTWDKEVDKIRLDLSSEVKQLGEQRRQYYYLYRKFSAVVPDPLRKSIRYLFSR